MVKTNLITFNNISLDIKIIAFQNGDNNLSYEQDRLSKEIPTILLLAIVLSAIIKF